MNAIEQELQPVIEWWENGGKKTAAAVVGAALVIGAYILWDVTGKNHELAAAQELVQPSGADISSFEGTAAGPALKRREAAQQYNLGAYELALSLYDELEAKPPKGFADTVAFGKARSLEALERFGEATAAYGEVVKNYPKSPVALFARIGVAQCMAQDGKVGEALAELAAIKGDETVKADSDALAMVNESIDRVRRWETRAKDDAMNAVLDTLAEEPVSPAAEAPAAPAEAPKAEAPAAPETPAAPAAAEAPAEAPKAE